MEQGRNCSSSNSNGTAAGGVKKMKSVATVDLEDLDCPVCFYPLEPPVFQCAAGHVVCSICYEKLPDKDKCQVCSITTGYNRCFAIERILQSVQVPCSNAGNGCTAKMAYHEKDEHEKKCMHMPLFCPEAVQPMLLHHGLPTDCYVLVMPKVSPSTSINISINDHGSEKKIHDNKSSMGSIVRMGPCGGGCGDARKMDMHGVNRIVRVVVRHGGAVDSMSVLYERNGLEEWTDQWGGPGGKRSEIRLMPDEYLTGVKGHYGHFGDWFVIRSLTFVGNRRSFGPYGKEEGVPFELPAAGGKILGFHARSGGLLDALGTYVKMV